MPPIIMALMLRTVGIFLSEVDIRYCSNVRGVKKLSIRWSFNPKYIPAPHVCDVRVAQQIIIAVAEFTRVFCSNLNKMAFENRT